MKITYISSSPVPSQAANSVHVMKMAQALARAGHDVTLYTPEHNRKEPSPVAGNVFAYYGTEPVFRWRTIPYLNIPFLKYRSAKWMTALLLLAGQPGLVFTRNLTAARVATMLGFKTLFERHDAFENVSEAELATFRKLVASRHFRKLVVISDSLKQEMMRKFGLAEDRIIVAHDGADAFTVSQPALPPAAGTVRFGYTGHLYEGRGIDVIGDVAAQLPTCEFHIVGGTPADVASWQDRFAGRSNIVFHGHVPPAAIPAYIASFDILLAPYQQKVAVSGNKGDTSRWMSPLKIFEYMSAGKPIICSDIPVLREVLRDGGNALLCPPADAAAWAGAIQSLVSSPSKANDIAASALADFTAHYSWQKRAEYILAQAL